MSNNPFTNLLDRLANSIGSYRLLLYVLIGLVGIAALLGFIGRIPISSADIIIGSLWLVVVSRITNFLFAKVFNVKPNKDSDLITALILALILTPGSTPHDLIVLAAVATIAMGSKYIIATRKRHIFNPAAFGAVAVSLIFGTYPSWWVGTTILTLFVLIGVLLVIRKVQRFPMVFTFVGTYLIMLVLSTWLHHDSNNLAHILWLSIVDSPLIFFAGVMLIEPLTSPTTKYKGILFAGLVGILYAAPQLRIHQVAFGPEVALLIGNLAAYLFAPNYRFKLKLLRQHIEAEGIYSFEFERPTSFIFKPGQFMEWTLPHNKSDSRGIRRYMTIASSPTEKELIITMRVPDKPSSFKQALMELPAGGQIISAELSGDFVLPKDAGRNLVFIAGGVGVTPFRSMAKYLLDNNDPRSVILLYSAKKPSELAFSDIFQEAQRKANFMAHYVTGKDLDQETIKQALPDYTSRLFYISGPLGFVHSTRQLLAKLGIPAKNIKTDYFPGYVA